MAKWTEWMERALLAASTDWQDIPKEFRAFASKALYRRGLIVVREGPAVPECEFTQPQWKLTQAGLAKRANA